MEDQEAGNHHTCQDHATGGKGSLERTFLLVVEAGIDVFVLEHQGEAHMHESNGKQAQADGPEQPCWHGVKTLGVVVDPWIASFCACVHGHVTGQVTHEE